MATTFTIPADYSYILALGIGAAIVNLWHGVQVSSARSAAKVPYPNAYASAVEASTSKEKHEFNCAQRAHSNFLENLPTFLIFAAISGLEWPKATAGMGAAWLVGRMVYALGYRKSSKANGKGRYYGFIFFYPPQLAIMGMGIYKTWNLIMN